MIKVVTCIKRKPGMSVEDFQAYWRGSHPEVVVRLPGIRRYVQSHTRLAGYRKGEPVFDGIAEVWFDDGRALHALGGTPEMAAVGADESRFIDREATRVIATDEHVIKDESVPAGAAKNVEFVTRKPGLAVNDFQRYWREIHGPLAAKIPMIRRYVQSHTRASAYERGRTPAYDGVAITWFDDTQAMRASAATAQYAVVRADEPNFITPGELPIIITTEHVILP
ncbi:MAG TPA: EthD domain-containing protein [Methylomirabilota bacterium]|nr:EthD domain-containing protein [Methylomirabilota bacterium]